MRIGRSLDVGAGAAGGYPPSGLVKHLSLAILVVVAASLAAAAPASAKTETERFRYPISVEPYQVKQDITIAQRPRVDGYITGMKADIVDANGEQVPIQRLMLHHIVFVTLGRRNPACSEFTGLDSQTKIPALFEPFYGAGEERSVLVMPEGYGYRMRQDDLWAMTYMVMNHRHVPDSAFIEWTVTYETDQLKHATPYWLDVENCKSDPVYDVPGGGPPGSTHTRTYDLTMPEDGRIIAAGGHVHGGGKSLELSQPDCGNRTVYTSRPTWGARGHPFYNVKPVLHEPGPINMSGFISRTGHPIKAGQRIRLTSNYDAERLHTRVMGISVIFVSHEPVDDGCGPLADDALDSYGLVQGRRNPPEFTVPITGRRGSGVARSISKPPGRNVFLRNGATIVADDFFFSRPNAVVNRGSRLNWRIGADRDCAGGLFGNSNKPGCTLHNVTVASGPRGFSSPNLNDGRVYSQRLTKPGKYRIFCALHPVDMTEVVTVRRNRRG
jgi:hypothetical protein